MGTSLATWQLVEAPPVVPLPYGLFSVAEPRLTTDDHWRLGVTWQSQACVATKATTGPCIEPEISPLDPDDHCSVKQYEPFTVYAYDNDPVIGHTIREHEANAVQRLVNGEQYSAEQMVWQMMTSAAPPVVDLTAFPNGVALGVVEQFIADTYHGVGVIHMNRLTATYYWEYLEKSGGRMTTKLGTPVVIGGGYEPISLPLSGDFLLYGTGAMVIYRGDIDTRENAVNRSNNTMSVIAQRDYVVGWDCDVLGVKGSFTPSSS